MLSLGLSMEKIVTTGLLLAGLMLPVVLFWLLRSRSRLHGLMAAALAVGVGWGLNVAWALASHGGATNVPGQANEDTVAIAMRFGWACPTVLVFLTWLAWRFKTRRGS